MYDGVLSLQNVITAVVVVLLAGIGTWPVIQQLRKIPYVAPPRSIRPEVYRILENMRDRLFNRSGEVRFTVFSRDPSDQNVFKPVARLGWGRSASASTARFRVGHGAAGRALELGPNFLLFNKRHNGALDKSEKDLNLERQMHGELFALTPDEVLSISQEQVTEVKGLVAGAMECGGVFKGVLCIDSKDADLIPHPDRDFEFWKELGTMVTKLALVLPAADQVADLELVSGNSPESPGGSISKVRFKPRPAVEAVT